MGDDNSTRGRRPGLLARAAWALCLAGASQACGDGPQTGGQTGDEDALPTEIQLPGGGTGDCHCVFDAPSALSSLDESPVDVAPDEVLSLAQLDGPVPLRFHAESEYDFEAPRVFETAGDDLPDAIQIEVDYAGGPITYLGPDDCWALQVEVEVSLRTDDDTFDERLTGTLDARGNTDGWWGSEPSAYLTFTLHRPETVVGGMRGTGTCGNPEGLAAQRGDLDVTQELDLRAPNDPIDGEWTLRQPGRMVALPFTLRFTQTGVRGEASAWLYGTEDGSLRRTRDVITFGATEPAL